jgi:hypothetical protein
MSMRVTLRIGCVILAVTLSARSGFGYIHFPPMTLQKMCKTSTHIRVLSVTKYDKEKGVVLFDSVETLKGQQSQVKSFKHVIRTDAEGVKPILDWVGSRKRALMFWIEGGGIACGYVFIDDYCYSVDYNRRGEYWLMIRADPQMSACYHGSVERLQKPTKDVLDGKEVKVPVKGPAAPVSREEKKKRYDEVNDILKKNRNK